MPYKVLKSVASQFPDLGVRAAKHAQEMRDWRAQMAIADKHRGDDSIPVLERYVDRPRPTEIALVEAAVNEDDQVDYEVVDDGPTPAQVLAGKKVAIIGLISRTEAAEVEKLVPPAKVRLVEFRRADVAVADGEIIARAMRAVDDERGALLGLNARHQEEIAGAIQVVEDERRRLHELMVKLDAAASGVEAARPGIIGAIVQSITAPSQKLAASLAAASDLEIQVKAQAEAVEKAEDALADWRGPMEGGAAADLRGAMQEQAAAVARAQDRLADRDGLLAEARDHGDHAFVLDYEERRRAAARIHRWAAQAMHDADDLTIDDVDSWAVPALPTGEK